METSLLGGKARRTPAGDEEGGRWKQARRRRRATSVACIRRVSYWLKYDLEPGRRRKEEEVENGQAGGDAVYL